MATYSEWKSAEGDSFSKAWVEEIGLDHLFSIMEEKAYAVRSCCLGTDDLSRPEDLVELLESVKRAAEEVIMSIEDSGALDEI